MLSGEFPTLHCIKNIHLNKSEILRLNLIVVLPGTYMFPLKHIVGPVFISNPVMMEKDTWSGGHITPHLEPK